MLNAVLITSFILLIIGCIGLVQSSNNTTSNLLPNLNKSNNNSSTNLLKNIISIETITIASILNILYYKTTNTSIVLLLTIIIISELNIAILFSINNKIKNI